MNRDDVTQAITAARIAQGLSWHDLAERINRPVVWTTAALLGQHPFTPEDAAVIAEVLDLPEPAAAILATVPYRGGLPTAVPTDPTIYRFYEALQVYGPALKEIIHEEFGDGIMSAIDFTCAVERVADPAGDRVKVTYDGKFLPYKGF